MNFQDYENNLRRFDRKQLYYYLKVYDGENGKLSGYLGDISASGMMLFSKTPIDPGRKMALRIELKEDFDLGETLALDARSLWCEPDANPEFYMIGFSFKEIDADVLDSVSYLMGKYGFDK